MEGAGHAIEQLFRQRAGQMSATLVRMFGAGRIDLIEDAVQDALIRAMRIWPLRGEPDNPAAWLIRAARNAMIDRLRRLGRESALDGLDSAAPDAGNPGFEQELNDDQLRLVFVCCHPSIPADGRIALTLKTAGGFTTREIARAFLAQEATVAQRLVRAKAIFRRNPESVAVPAGPELPARLDAVLEALYLIFNEGYSALDGEDLVRTDLCAEAMRLAELLAAHPVTAHPRVEALAALFAFQAARLPGRSDAAGELLLLADQDRGCWDQAAIRRGLRHMEKSASGSELSRYHLEAEIAACHSVARDFASTDWARVVACYDELCERQPSPVAALNRAIAIAELRGAAEGLRELDALDARALDGYYPYHAARGELSRRMGDWETAAASFRRALDLASCAPVRRFLARRLPG